MTKDRMTVNEALDLYGNDLARYIAERYGLTTATDEDYARAMVSDFANFPIDALTGSFFDNGKLWYAMYKQAGVLDTFIEWYESIDIMGFPEGVREAWAILGSGPWGTGRFHKSVRRTRDDVYVAVVAMAVSYSFDDVYDLLMADDD